jgi:hypothetical protein
MRRTLLVCGGWVLASAVVLAVTPQEALPPQSTTIQPTTHWEIIHSFALPWVTLRIDKNSGETYRLGADEDGHPLWVTITRLHHDKDTIKSLHTNYQCSIAPSGAALLMNVNTGATWYLDVDHPKGAAVWKPFE